VLPHVPSRTVVCNSKTSFFILLIFHPDGGFFSWPKRVAAWTFNNKVAFRRNGILLLLRHCKHNHLESVTPQTAVKSR